MPNRTRAITHSSVFARIANSRPSNALVAAALHHELLHGVAAQDAFVALFDQFPDFEELAREATQAPIPPDPAEPPLRRERQATRRGGVARRSNASAQPVRGKIADVKPRA